jgi:hypothetical protein
MLWAFVVIIQWYGLVMVVAAFGCRFWGIRICVTVTNEDSRFGRCNYEFRHRRWRKKMWLLSGSGRTEAPLCVSRKSASLSITCHIFTNWKSCMWIEFICCVDSAVFWFLLDDGAAVIPAYCSIVHMCTVHLSFLPSPLPLYSKVVRWLLTDWLIAVPDFRPWTSKIRSGFLISKFSFRPGQSVGSHHDAQHSGHCGKVLILTLLVFLLY